MVLNRKYREFNMLHAFLCPVVKIFMGQCCLTSDTFDINTIVMILGCYFNPPCSHVFNRMVAAVVTELEFVRPATHCKAEYLMSKADSENRFFTQELFCVPDSIGDGLRISGAVTQDNAIRSHFKDCLCRSLCRNNSDLEPCLDK